MGRGYVLWLLFSVTGSPVEHTSDRIESGVINSYQLLWTNCIIESKALTRCHHSNAAQPTMCGPRVHLCAYHLTAACQTSNGCLCRNTLQFLRELMRHHWSKPESSYICYTSYWTHAATGHTGQTNDSWTDDCTFFVLVPTYFSWKAWQVLSLCLGYTCEKTVLQHVCVFLCAGLLVWEAVFF